MNSTVLTIMCFLVLLSFALPRKYFLFPFIVGACFVPSDQRIIIFGLDFTLLRVLIVSGFLRILLRGEKVVFRYNFSDKLVFCWMIIGAFIYIVQWRNTSALIYKSGMLFDGLGLYWLFRLNIKSWEDLKKITKIFALCSLVLCIFVVKEWVTGSNPFKLLGHVNTVIREDRYRCQGPFPHSIILGLFWATLLPLFIGLVKSGRENKLLYWFATVASAFMVFSTTSSTPLVCMASVVFFLCLFRYRRYGKEAFCGFLCVLCGLHIIMKAPVWHLIARINLIGGSTGYHRFNLIDKAISHFSEWALLGTRSTKHWGWGLDDVTNHYIGEAIHGGLVGLILFVAVLALSVKTVWRCSMAKPFIKEWWLVWGLCVALLGHCISFFGVSYFGQIRLLLFLMFAISGWIYESLLVCESGVIAGRTRAVKKVSDDYIRCHS